jgi:hypothetical protein
MKYLLCLLLFLSLPALAQTASTVDGVNLTQAEIDLRDAVNFCMAHLYNVDAGPANADIWPEPCTTINNKYHGSSAETKYIAIYKKERALQLQELQKVIK